MAVTEITRGRAHESRPGVLAIETLSVALPADALPTYGATIAGDYDATNFTTPTLNVLKEDRKQHYGRVFIACSYTAYRKITPA